MQEVIAAILLLAAPVIATGGLSLLVPMGQRNLRLILAFSAAYLFAISIIHMLPDVISTGNARLTGLFIVLGFCMQIVIDTFSTGIEHGHVHQHSENCETFLPVAVITGLFLHSFLEGLPVYDVNSPEQYNVNFQLILGLAVHNVPITIAFTGLLRGHTVTPRMTAILLIMFSLMSPLGYLASYLLQSWGLQNYQAYSNAAYALVIGIFLHISTTTLFESSVNHKYNVAKFVVMTLGIILAYLVA